MKKSFIPLLALALAGLNLSSAVVQSPKAVSLITGKEIAREKMLPVIRDVEPTEERTTISYHIENVLLEPDSLFNGAYKCVISDFGSLYAEGAPALPARRDFVELPFGCDTASVIITNATYVDIPCELAPAYPFWVGKTPRFTREKVGEMAACDFRSQNDVVTVTESYMRNDRKQLNILVAPCQYSSSEKKMRVYTDVEYTVEYAPVNQQKVAAYQAAMDLQFEGIRNDVLKAKFGSPSDTDAGIQTLSSGYGSNYTWVEENKGSYIYNYYQIITVDEYLEAAEEFAAFKRQFGYKTHISSKPKSSKWSVQEIKDSINAHYIYVSNATVTPVHNYYILIIGGHSDVPAETTNGVRNDSGEVTTFFTDFYYGCYRWGSSTNKQWGVGRIPVNTPEEAMTVVHKIKNYVLTPPTEDRFYKTGAHIAFYTYDHDTSFGPVYPEADGFIYSSEQCRNKILDKGLGLEITRLYGAPHNLIPEEYGKEGTDEVTPLPSELRKPGFRWDADKNSIATEINNGCFYALYRGHGDAKYYADFGLSTYDIRNMFLNGGKLPVFFNMTCLTGKFKESDCVAEALLKHEEGGGGAVIAASEKTNHFENCALTNALLPNTLEKSVREIYYDDPRDIINNGRIPPSCELNSMLTKALDTYPTYYESSNGAPRFYQKRAYHIFGDPSMWMWVKKPRSYTSSEVFCTPHYNGTKLSYVEVMINLPNERCYVAVENKRTHNVTLEYGNVITYPRFDPSQYNMTIYGLNRIPKVLSFQDRDIIAPQSNEIYSPTNNIGSSATIFYHNYDYTPGRDTPYGSTPGSKSTITVTQISTGAIKATYDVYEHFGMININISGYPAGIYLLTLQPFTMSGDPIPTGRATGYMIIK